MVRMLIVTSALFAMPAFAMADKCGTEVGGGFVSGTWEVANSPYCVNGDIFVNGLSIEPGVQILVAGGVTIEVVTTIKALGEPENPILFEPRTAVPWRGLLFRSTPAGSKLEYCSISGSNDSGLRLIEATPPKINGCVFTSNTGTDGAGIFAELLPAQVLEITGCTFAVNGIKKDFAASGVQRGAGIFVKGGSCRIKGSVFRSNSLRTRGIGSQITKALGGGAYVSGAATFENCLFVENTCKAFVDCVDCPEVVAAGGGVYIESGDLTLRNCFFSCNEVRSNGDRFGGGVYVSDGAIASNIENCTFARHNADALWVASTAAAAVRNSILYWNTGSQFTGPVVFEYSDVQGGAPGIGNISLDPMFAGVDDCEPCGVFLQPGSPCIDAGDPSSSFDDGCTPPAQGTILNDMGAFGGPLACGSPSCVGTRYCSPAIVNSTKEFAAIQAFGSDTASENNLMLCATHLPPKKPGFFLASQIKGFTVPPGSQGILCLAAPIARFSKLLQVAGAGGTFCIDVDLTNIPLSPPATVMAGETWNFQAWYRDKTEDGPTSNFTDGAEVVFK